ncbi:unnamed protein product [Closterium sp. NIES-64]|nr:unnamed protein product [Closterium sp. NIES-65]CAI5981547.1 unnamed protein product [Closterium sp. NIES-64]
MRRRLKCAHGGPNSSSLCKIPHVAGEGTRKGATPVGASDTGANGDSSDSAKSALRAETPSASQESGQQRGAARRSPGLDEGCGTEPAPPARADIRAPSARAEEPPPRRNEGRWSPQCVRESALHSPAPDAQPPQTHSLPDPGQDPACDRFRHAHRHSAGPDGLRNQPNADAEGTARDDPNPSDAQVTPSPASREIAAESVARGIALGVGAGLPDHEEMGGEVNEDAQGTADRPPCAVEFRDAQEKVGEERAAAEADAEASARAPAAAVCQGGSMQRVQGPTNTPARWGAQQADGEELAPARSGGRARLRRGAHGTRRTRAKPGRRRLRQRALRGTLELRIPSRGWIHHPRQHRSRRQRADQLRTRRTRRPRQDKRELRVEEEPGEYAWDAAATAADAMGTEEDEEVEEHDAPIGAAPAQADTRERQKG